MILTSSCASTGGSETEAALCDELRQDLPTWSMEDTARSRTEGAAFVLQFDKLCGV